MVTVSISGMSELKSLFNNLPREKHERIMEKIEDTASKIENKQKDKVPRNYGAILQSISSKRASKNTVEIVAQKDYAPYVEFGTKKKVKVPQELQEVAKQFMGKGKGDAEKARRAILEWVRIKGIRFDSAATYKSGKKKGQNKKLTAEQTGYIIFHFIMLNGIKPQPFFFPPYFEERAKLIEDVKNILVN